MTEPEGWYSGAEQERLAELVQQAPAGNLVEIGVYRGKSARIIVEHAKGRLVTLIDTLVMEGADPELWPSGPGINRMIADPLDWPWSRHPIRDIALFHQDAAHDYKTVLAHLKCFGYHIVPGGILVLHDYHAHQFPGVAMAFGDWELHREFEPLEGVDSMAAFRRKHAQTNRG